MQKKKLTGGKTSLPAHSVDLRLFVKVEAIVANLLQFGKHLLVIDASAPELDVGLGALLHGEIRTVLGRLVETGQLQEVIGVLRGNQPVGILTQRKLAAERVSQKVGRRLRRHGVPEHPER